jgi:hypothetical protein
MTSVQSCSQLSCAMDFLGPSSSLDLVVMRDVSGPYTRRNGVTLPCECHKHYGILIVEVLDFLETEHCCIFLAVCGSPVILSHFEHVCLHAYIQMKIWKGDII